MHSFFVAVRSFLVSFAMSTFDINSLSSEEVLCRPTECLLQWKLYSVGRHDTSAIGYCTLTAVTMLAPIGNCTLSAVIMLAPIGNCTLSAVIMLAPTGNCTLSAVIMLAPIGNCTLSAVTMLAPIGNCTLSAVTMLASDRKRRFYILSRNSAT